MTFLRDSWLPPWLPLTLEQGEGEHPLLEEAELAGLEEAELEEVELEELEEEEEVEGEQQREERKVQG